MQISDLVAKLRLAHELTTARQSPKPAARSTTIRLPERPRQLTPHKPVENYRLRTSQL